MSVHLVVSSHILELRGWAASQQSVRTEDATSSTEGSEGCQDRRRGRTGNDEEGLGGIREAAEDAADRAEERAPAVPVAQQDAEQCQRRAACATQLTLFEYTILTIFCLNLICEIVSFFK